MPLSDTNKNYLKRIRAGSIEHRKKVAPVKRLELGDKHGRKDLTNSAGFDPYNAKNANYWGNKKLINSTYNEKKEVNELVYTKDQVFGAEQEVNHAVTDRILAI